MDEIPLLNGLFSKYRYSALKRGIEFSLDRDAFKQMIKDACYICGTEPSNRLSVFAKRRNQTRVAVYSGIDRLDNGRGYVPGNVAPCCANCNSIKSKRSLQELKDHLEKMIIGLKDIA